MATINAVVPNGLFVTPDFITEVKERNLISWSTELSRRTQHYSKGDLQPTTSLSGPLLQLQQKFAVAGHNNLIQCIVNEYYRDQGIAPHIDRNIFGPVIIGVSLGADTVMSFERSTNDVAEVFDCLLPRRSLVMLTDEARSQWKHGISKKVTYINATGHKINKDINYRRISCTFRSVLNA